MSTYNFIQVISEDECMGDSLPKINNNFANLDAGTTALSSNLIANYNTLVGTLTAVGAPGTTYNSLSSIFRSLSAYLLP